MKKELKDIIDVDGLAPDERDKLQRVHELLVAAGPPAELPPELEEPVDTEGVGAEVIAFPLMPRRRVGAAVLLAAAAAAATFVGGFVWGHSKARPTQLAIERVVTMHGKNGLAVLNVGKPDAVGNWPMEMRVSGLPRQPQRTAYYELWLTQKGGPNLPCGTFRVHSKTTTVRLSVPYSFKHASGWVVTRQTPGGSDPGPTVLTT
jgi:hypothetical protein